ncbi:MAG: GGDEF domain-containing protein [Chloroflexota bacterium]|nr:GGDEF domain-containing protein [Chloroflexota bacterium]
MTAQPTHPRHLSPVRAAEAGPARGLYERVIRVVSYLFIGSALIVVTVADGALEQPLLYVLLAAGALVIVLSQDVLPMAALGGWRFAIEALVVIVFITVLVALTGGHDSPFFFGYLLLLAGTSLWAQGLVPVLLALVSTVAYLGAVLWAPTDLTPEQWARVLFNIVALGLVSYVAAVIGREQRRASEAALALARFDALTGLHSRSYFERALEQEILRAGRSGRPFSLLMFDLDALKKVNDSLGHESGDRLLRAIGEIISEGIRGTDLAARLGGDEFVVILPETELSGALRVADKLRRDIGQLSLPHNGRAAQSSVSVGVVTYPDDALSGEELLRRADRAMYEAKRRGKDQIVHYPRPAHPGRQASPAAASATVTAASDEQAASPEGIEEAPPTAGQDADATAVTGTNEEIPPTDETGVVITGAAPWERSED